MTTLQAITMYANYNIWANAKVAEWCEAISEEQWNQEVISSFNSIAATVVHIVGGEKIWLDRFENAEIINWWPNEFVGNKAEALSEWTKSSLGLAQFTASLDANNLFRDMSYTRLNGESFVNPLYHLLQHVINHSSYHRGQIVTMLRQIEFTDISSLDYATYYNRL